MLMSDFKGIKDLENIKHIEGIETVNEEDLTEIYNRIIELNNISTFIATMLVLFFGLYILNGLILYKWSRRYIDRYDFKIGVLDCIIPIWNNLIFFNLLKLHSKRKYNIYIIVFIVLSLFSLMVPYLLLFLYFFVFYVKGKIFRVYLLDKNLIYLHYFSLGIFTPFLLWKER